MDPRAHTDYVLSIPALILLLPVVLIIVSIPLDLRSLFVHIYFLRFALVLSLLPSVPAVYTRRLYFLCEINNANG